MHQIPIQRRLPNGVFPFGFAATLLLNPSTSFYKKGCNNFLDKKGFFESARHEADSDTVKGIKEGLKKCDEISEKKVIIDSETQVTNGLNPLLGL